jgi:hypothetical protein
LKRVLCWTTFDRVRAETSIDDILEVLEARLPGALPADQKQRLADLGRDQLKKVLRRSATPASLEEALVETGRHYARTLIRTVVTDV